LLAVVSALVGLDLVAPFLGYQDRLSIPDPDHDLAKEVPVLMFPVPPTAMTRMTCSLPGKIDSR